MTTTRESQLQQDISRLERSINEIQEQIAYLAEVRQAQKPTPVLAAAEGDPVEEARREIAAEKVAKQLAEEQTALYAVLARYQEPLTAARAELTRLQRERVLESSRAIVEAANNKLIAIATEIESLRDRQKELLIQAVKLSRDPELKAAFKDLDITESYLDVCLVNREASGFDSPNLGKLNSLSLVLGDRLKGLPPTQKWAIVSQSLVSSGDLRNG